MNEQKTLVLTPALIGGAIAGVLSGIPIVSCMCCLWIIGGAILSTYLLGKNTPTPLASSDGAIIGVFTGIVAAVVKTILDVILTPLNKEIYLRLMERFAEYMQEMPPGFEEMFSESSFETTVPKILFELLISGIIFSALGALGGIIGISLFKKKPPQPPQGAPNVPENTGNRQP
ncbi:MAG: hypothetical protein JSV46_07500 [Candidatus Aminicenantes bacterium]|nr:MAG: hypothetical protein JSV46_07500 [Candidatus Aminicenantes bacterium]